MCMEDIRVMRKSQSVSKAISVTNTAQEVLSSSPDRVALVLGAPSVGSITYFDQDNPVFGSGFTLGVASNPIQLNIQLDGEMVVHRWWAIADAAGPRLAAVGETLLSER